MLDLMTDYLKHLGQFKENLNMLAKMMILLFLILF